MLRKPTYRGWGVGVSEEVHDVTGGVGNGGGTKFTGALSTTSKSLHSTYSGLAGSSGHWTRSTFRRYVQPGSNAKLMIGSANGNP